MSQKFSRFWFFSLGLLFISATVNLTLFEGRFLNIFKTELISLIIFNVIYNSIYRNRITEKKYFIGVIILMSSFLVKTWPEMQVAWGQSGDEFTNVNIFSSSLNLNSWGYILVLFLVIMLYFYVIKIYRLYAFIFIFILISFIFFSYSRTAYTLSLLAIFWCVIYVNKFKIKKILFFLIFAFLLYLFRNELNVFNFNVSSSALEFISNKSGGYENDLINTRFYLINIQPVVENYEMFSPLEMLLGDGVSVQHSFPSHYLVVNGVLGFIYFMKRFLFAFRLSIRNIIRNQEKIKSKMLLLVLGVILINDFVTNVSSFLPFAAYLSSLILALIFGHISKTFKLKEYGE